jgi:hypothetical protein
MLLAPYRIDGGLEAGKRMDGWMDGCMHGWNNVWRVEDLEGVDDELVHRAEQIVARLKAVRCFDVHTQVLMQMNSGGEEG